MLPHRYRSSGEMPSAFGVRRHSARVSIFRLASSAFAGEGSEYLLTAYHEDLSLREAALKHGFVTAEQFDAWVRPDEMTQPLE